MPTPDGGVQREPRSEDRPEEDPGDQAAEAPLEILAIGRILRR